MADNRQIVGWFYRNGKRIPIKANDGLTEKTRSYYKKIKSAESDDIANQIIDDASFDDSISNDDYTKLMEKVDKHMRLNRYPGAKKEQLKTRAGKSQDKYITDKVGANGYKYKSVDYDTSGGHVHKDVETKGEARQFLRRNSVLKVKRSMQTGSGITEKNGKFYLKSPVNGTQRIFNTKEAAQNYLRNADVIDSHARGLGRSAEYAGPHTKKKR